MVAKIIISKSIQKTLNYNESKLKDGKATCIYAANFLKEADTMNFYDKLQRFKDLILRNERATTNSLHISLNFDPSEKLSEKTLSDIAVSYMTKIGFADQPYLVYKHNDAGHPHIHVVTTNIKLDGSRINTHNIGRDISEPARKEIERLFGLVKAQGRKQEQQGAQAEVNKIVYGKSETKRAITNVLDSVINQYAYSSLPELNAILKQYNVLADRGHAEGRIYKQRGLVFRVLDEQGQKIGVPIKASSIYSKPTLTSLEKKFELNVERKSSFRSSVKRHIEDVLQKSSNLKHFAEALKKENIQVIFRRNESGFVYGVTYVDTHNKVVFNGSDLGKLYSAAGLQETFTKQGSPEISETKVERDKKTSSRNKTDKQKSSDLNPEKEFKKPSEQLDLFGQVLKPEKNEGFIPYQLRKRKKKKKRRNLGL